VSGSCFSHTRSKRGRLRKNRWRISAVSEQSGVGIIQLPGLALVTNQLCCEHRRLKIKQHTNCGKSKRLTKRYYLMKWFSFYKAASCPALGQILLPAGVLLTRRWEPLHFNLFRSACSQATFFARLLIGSQTPSSEQGPFYFPSIAGRVSLTSFLGIFAARRLA